MQARFISLEGIDGAGKSTHVEFIRSWLQQRGIDNVFTREPGGTAIGEHLRELLLDVNSKISLDTETMLMFAARMEHIIQVIRPALFSGKWVVSDRFTDATFAYQGGGRKMPYARIEQLESWVQQGLQPDLTLLFDAPLAIAQQRTNSRQALDRFESEKSAFHQRVRDTYLERAKANPQRFAIINTDCAISETEQNIAKYLMALSI